jgi:hypothetical protein
MKEKNQVPDYTKPMLPDFPTDLAYNSVTPCVYIPPEAQSNTTVQVLDNSFNDDVAQYIKTPESIQRNAELLRVRNQAMGPADFDPSNPPLIGRQDSDPKGG